MIKDLIVAFLLLTVIAIPSQSANKYAAKSELEAKLSACRTPSDSVKILYDLLDISANNDKIPIAIQIYHTAARYGDQNAQLDVLRQLTGLYDNDVDRLRMQQMAEKMPASREQAETVLYIKMRRIASHSRDKSLEDQQHELSGIVRRLNDPDKSKINPYDHLLDLFTLTSFLRNTTNTGIATQYLDSLVALADNSNYELYALRNMIYSGASSIYSDTDNPEKAVKTSKEVLKIIKELEQKYKGMGRKYRNYDTSYYVFYRRLLHNHTALTPQEVELYHKRIMEIASRDKDVAADLASNPTALSHYYMARKEYDKALPYLKVVAKRNNSLPMKRAIFADLQTAARETGDSVTLLSALDSYNHVMEEIEKSSINAKLLELQLAYDVNTLKARNTQLQLDKANAQATALRNNMTYSLAVWLIIAILLAILLFYWTRNRANIQHLARFAVLTSTQRDKLQQTRYAETDQDEEAAQRILDKSKALGKCRDSRTLLQSILSDILYISAIGRDDRIKHISTVSMNHSIEQARKQAMPLIKPGHDVDVTYADPDFDIVTDRECLEYLVSHIISFADSRSETGDVTLEVKHSPGSNTAQIVFTHSGDRIPRGHEESLFHNFVDWDELHNLDNSALFICRMIAFLLRCNIAYNPHVEGTARLVVSIPVKVTHN